CPNLCRAGAIGWRKNGAFRTRREADYVASHYLSTINPAPGWLVLVAGPYNRRDFQQALLITFANGLAVGWRPLCGRWQGFFISAVQANLMIKISKGLDLPISGAPEQRVETARPVRSVAVIGFDYPGMKPTMEV